MLVFPKHLQCWWSPRNGTPWLFSSFLRHFWGIPHAPAETGCFREDDAPSGTDPLPNLVNVDAGACSVGSPETGVWARLAERTIQHRVSDSRTGSHGNERLAYPLRETAAVKDKYI